VLGSPGFWPPEQVTDDEVGPPGDVFSLGALVAFAASGQAPFSDGATAGGVLYLGVNDNNFADNSGSWQVNVTSARQ
jgi:eukaryotic-like serine/threonine-protein kinase